jgi:hypothetical protein
MEKRIYRQVKSTMGMEGLFFDEESSPAKLAVFI